jgi:hypothetical protein
VTCRTGIGLSVIQPAPESAGCGQPTRRRGRHDARTVVQAVADELSARRLRRVYWSADNVMGVVSVVLGLNAWYFGGRFLRWRDSATVITWPAAGAHGAASRLVELARRGQKDTDRSVRDQ